MRDTIELLKREGELRVIEDRVDIYLEIPHIAYVEVKKPNGGDALLFTNPVDNRNKREFKTPILMNLFGSDRRLELLVGDSEKIVNEIEKFLHMKPPTSLFDKFSMFKDLLSIKGVFPKRLSQKGESQQIIKLKSEVNLFDIPVLTTWEQDGGPFITMGQVYTQSLDGEKQNLGMYRVQVFSKNEVGLHWQIHKDSNHFFHEYKKANRKMPVSVAIGGDPLYTYCGTAPLPIGVFELMLYGFIKRKSAELVKSITNDIYIPKDVDFVIEGFVDTSKLKIEGPFGDHTGYYTLEDEYPSMQVSAITSKKEPTYLATVVGKPPIEDKYMGYATERIFLPLIKTQAPDLIDYRMPENGVFHNLIIAKISPLYPAHAKQIMHTFWGVGQMSFVKHAIFVGEDAPELTDYEELFRYILNRFQIENLLITEGVCDALDHSSDKFAQGGKLGIDCTGDEVKSLDIELLSDEELLSIVSKLECDVKALKQYGVDTKNPITVIAVDKLKSQKATIDILKSLKKYIKILVIIDFEKNRIDNPYMTLWRVVNNIDSRRDIVIEGNFLAIDATNKSKEFDNFPREWPDDVECNREVLNSLIERKIIDIDEDFILKNQL